MKRPLWAEFLLFEALFTIVLYPTRHHVYWAVILAALIYITTRFYLELGAVKGAYVLWGRIVTRFLFTAYILCVEGSFPNGWRRAHDGVHAKVDPDSLGNLPSNFPLTKKLWWTLDLAYSPRMVGWVREPQDRLPPHPPPSHITFLWKTFLKCILNTLVLDLTSLVFTQSSAFDSRMHDPTDGPETYLAAIPLLRRVPYVLAFCVRLGSWMSRNHNMVALVCVGLGGSNPTLWPDFMGDWRDAYTVRKLWRRSWHQMLRPTLSGWGTFVANKVLKFPRGTNSSSYTQLYIGFVLSGIIHVTEDYALETRMVYHSMGFFVLQAVAITFEDSVIYIAKQLSLPGVTKPTPGKADASWVGTVVRVIGYCWVILWLCLTLPMWQDGHSAVGFNTVDRGYIGQFLWDSWKQWA